MKNGALLSFHCVKVCFRNHWYNCYYYSLWKSRLTVLFYKDGELSYHCECEKIGERNNLLLRGFPNVAVETVVKVGKGFYFLFILKRRNGVRAIACISRLY